MKKWRKFMPSNHANKITGRLGEDIACNFLEKLGYKILAKNYRYSRFAEIDIVAKDKDTIVFTEVKTRCGTNFGHPFEAVNHKKRRRDSGGGKRTDSGTRHP